MAFSKKTWLQRIVENPGRRLLTPTGTTNVYDIARNEGVVVQAGDAFSVANMNDLETRVDNGIKEITPTTKTVIWTSGYTPSSQLVHKEGNIVTIQLRYDATSITNAFQIGVVPSDCIPTTSTGFNGIAMYLIGGVWKACFIQITNTGAILVANSSAETMTYVGGIIQYSVA